MDIVSILSKFSEGTKLYSPIFGIVELYKVLDNFDVDYPIICTSDSHQDYVSFTRDGKYSLDPDAECLLFPSKDNRDWSAFVVSNSKKACFNIKMLKPFDKVLVRDEYGVEWVCGLFSFYDEDIDKVMINEYFSQCVPYNDDTAHLVGTTDEAPEYYRWWED